MKTSKTNTQIWDQYEVRTDLTMISSNLVYPMDVGTKYQFHGYVNEEDIKDYLHLYFGEKVTRIANKYAIPFMQVAQMHTVQTFFYYQHDNKTWLISLTEETNKYFG